MPRYWKIIFPVILAILLALGEGIGLLIIIQGSPAIGMTLRWICRIAAAMWILFGLYLFRQIKWVGRISKLTIITVIAGLIAGLCSSLGSVSGLIAIAGIYAMGIGFYLGLLLIHFILLPGWAFMGVARTLINEAMRMKVPLIFIVGIMLIVPVLPFSMDASEKLQYRIQSFLSWSTMAVFLLLSLMTIFLAVGTITRELDHKQIYLTLTKPVSRVQYLAGKWLGIMLLNLVLIVVSGMGIYSFTQILKRQPAKSAQDRAAVENQVLVARYSINPKPYNPQDLQAQFQVELKKSQRSNPQTFGNANTPASDLSRSARKAIQGKVIRQWYTLGPRSSQTYKFTGLNDITGKALQLRIKPNSASQSPYVRLQIQLNGRYYYLPNITHGAGVLKLSAGDYHVLPIPTSIINDQGVLIIKISNPHINGQKDGTVSFNTSSGIELFYRAGGFEANLARALLLLWIRLAFLTMLGLAAGSFLGFPIATLLCILIYIAAWASSYLHQSLQYYTAFPDTTSAGQAVWIFIQSLFGNLAHGKIYGTIKLIAMGVSSVFLKVVPAFGSTSPAPLLANGRLVGWPMIGQALLWVALVWTGCITIAAWLIFRVRELARVTV